MQDGHRLILDQTVAALVSEPVPTVAQTTLPRRAGMAPHATAIA
jgi:hypothetical protein